MEDVARALSAPEAAEYLRFLDLELEKLIFQRRELVAADRVDLAYDRKLEIAMLSFARQEFVALVRRPAS